ncbi:MAG: hypothetical protein M1812_002543 [Candelaria pacifica]|nr:MAG: hypothetical protein M1812_002543 [Candelaria pacifica]
MGQHPTTTIWQWLPSASLVIATFLQGAQGRGAYAFDNSPRSASSSSIKTNEQRPHILKPRAATDSNYNTQFENVTWDSDNWRLTTTSLDQGHYQARMSVANGYIGLNVAAVGPFFEADVPVGGDNVDEWPLFDRRQTFAGLAGFYDSQPTTNGTNFEWLNQYGGESAISGIPHWGGLIVELSSGQYLDASVNSSTISNFKSSFDFRNALMTWSLTWTPSGSSGASLDLEYSLFVHKLLVNQASVQLSITPSRDLNGTVTDVLDGTSATRTTFVQKAMTGNSIWTAVKPNGIDSVTAYLYSSLAAGDSSTVNMSSRVLVSNKPYIGTNDSSIAQSVNVSLKAGQTTVISKYIGAASTDAFNEPQNTAEAASLFGKGLGFERLLALHTGEWANVMPEGSVDDYSLPNGTLPDDPNIVELAIFAVVNPFFLLQNTVSKNAKVAAANASIDVNSISVCGLTSSCYAGQIFWDAEIWMQPGLVVAFPEAATQIANYRVAKYPQAQKNVGTAYQSSKNQTHLSSEGAIFSWTSGRFGNCTGTGPCFDYEYHINGDIAQEMLNYWIVTGDTEFFETQLFPVYNSIAITYSELLEHNATTGEWELKNATDPDEFANHVDNGAYTMALIATTLSTTNTFRSMFNMTPNATFDDQAANIALPRDTGAGIVSEYTSMNGSISVKQADVVLITFPLDYTDNYTSLNSLTDLDYYAAKQSPSGPGMTYSIFSIIANSISPSGCSSFTYDIYASQPYARAPWFQFSEQLTDEFANNGGFHPAFPFLTGHGGDNQITIFGYLGLRLQLDRLDIDPSLPPQIPTLRYRTIYWQGHPITAFSNQTHTTLSRSPTTPPLTTANSTYLTTPIPISLSTSSTNTTYYILSPNSTLTLPNRRPSLKKTLPGNILQCLAVTSPDAYEPGQFPLAAIDGAVSTKWQPSISNQSASLTVDLGPQTSYIPIIGLSFDWAQNPPLSYTVTFSNTSSSSSSSTINSTNSITVSSSTNISISNPYDINTAYLVSAYQSNTTNITLPSPVWSGRFATLSIVGNQGDLAVNASGATVAEWAILGRV